MPSPLALLLPTLQMAGQAEEGRVMVAAHASAQAACTLELGLPGKVPGERQLLTTLQALASPAPSLLVLGRREDSLHWLWGRWH